MNGYGFQAQIFLPAGALAFADDAPSAEICLLDGGYFLFESHLNAAAGNIGRFLERSLR
jgi:hypothetical protein